MLCPKPYLPPTIAVALVVASLSAVPVGIAGKNNRRKKRTAKEFVRSDIYCAGLKKLPRYMELGGSHLQDLRDLARDYACLALPKSVPGGSLEKKSSGMVEAYQKEIELLKAYEQKMLEALESTGRRPPLRNGAMMVAVDRGRLAGGGIEAVMRALERGQYQVVRDKASRATDGLIEVTSTRLRDARFYRDTLQQFVGVIREVDERATDLRGKITQWTRRAERLGAASPMDPEQVRTVTSEGKALVEEGNVILDGLPHEVLAREDKVPTAGVVPEDPGDRYTSTSPNEEAEVIRSTIEKACRRMRRRTHGELEAITRWTQILREGAGLATGHFIVPGAQAVDGEKGPSAVALLERQFGEFGQGDGQDNRGRYRNQSAVMLAQRLVWHALHQIREADDKYGRNDAREINRRALKLRQQAGIARLSDELTVADILRDPAKVTLALGLDSPTPLHAPNKTPRYKISKDQYNSVHELLAWRGLGLLEMLARGTPKGATGPKQENLGWTFSLSDDGHLDSETFWTKLPRAWDEKRLLAGQVRVGSAAQFWSRFWGDPPVENEGRIVARAAQLATVQLLVEKRFVEQLPRKQRLEIGARNREWVDQHGIKLAQILGLAEVPAEALRAVVEAPKGGSVDPMAEQLIAQGRRFSQEIAPVFRKLKKRPRPWFEPFAQLVRNEALEVAFDARQGLMVLQPEAAGN